MIRNKIKQCNWFLISVLLALVFCGYILVRNNQVLDAKWDIGVYTFMKIQEGGSSSLWSCDIYSYEEMLFTIWRPVSSFKKETIMLIDETNKG